MPTTSILGDVGSFKGLGKLQIVDSGNNYTVGDLIDFDNYGVYGSGAKARVSETNASGSIINTEFEYDYYENFELASKIITLIVLKRLLANVRETINVLGRPNVYISNTVVDLQSGFLGVIRNNVIGVYNYMNVGMRGVYMTPQSNNNGLSFVDGDSPVRIGDVISVLGHERKVVNVTSNVRVTIFGTTHHIHKCGFLTVDEPFPDELDFVNNKANGSLFASNGNYFGTRGTANSLNTLSIRGNSQNVFGI